MTRVGRFADIDPSVPGRVWNRRHWSGFVFWLAVLGGSLRRARHRLRG